MQRIGKLLYIGHLWTAFSDVEKTIRMYEIKYGSNQ